MLFAGETQRLLTLLLFSFIAIFSMAAFRAVFGPDTILQRDDNGRLVEAEAGVIRGELFDRNHILLAESIRNPDRTVSRNYLYPEFDGTLGYYSLVYGVEGVEAAYDDLLRNEDLVEGWTTYLREEIMHIPRQGYDLQLTFDMRVQNVAASSLDGRMGAVVVLSVPDGEIVAMVSRPAYDPNQLDETWDELVDDPGTPFFDRALQGDYQPGSLFHMPLMLQAYANAFSTDVELQGGADAIELDDLTLRCVHMPTNDTLSLEEAFLYGCPSNFVQLVDDVSLSRAATGINRFYSSVLDVLPDGYFALIDAGTSVVAGIDVDEFSLEDLLGQGKIVLSPLSVAIISAAIANDGNGPQPFLLLATRKMSDAPWVDFDRNSSEIPVTTAENAAILRNLMIASVNEGGSTAARRPDLDIGGQSALAIVGNNRTVAWFTGFIVGEGREGFSIAVVLENTNDPEQVAYMGGKILQAAVQSLSAAE